MGGAGRQAKTRIWKFKVQSCVRGFLLLSTDLMLGMLKLFCNITNYFCNNFGDSRHFTSHSKLSTYVIPMVLLFLSFYVCVYVHVYSY